MKDLLLKIIDEYLEIFPNEKERLSQFIKYLKEHNDKEITDWNNTDGHVVVGGFIYNKTNNKFLMLYHNDLDSFLYPGGHIESNDNNPLDTAKREIYEETGINNITEIPIKDNRLVPIDIDTHVIPYNERINLKEHFHYEFRYLFIIDDTKEIKLELNEVSKYKWVSINELKEDNNYQEIVKKIEELI